jgi:2-oxoisovalerate dehydrogenase E1 component subunit alpha
MAGTIDEEPLRILPREGEPREPDLDALGLRSEDLRELYRWMVLVRRADLEATALQRQGELAVYPPLLGQEAAQVGSAYALGPDDWIFPSYRELGAALVRGVDPVDYLLYYRGTWHGGMYDPAATGFAQVSVPVGSQSLHAVGYAMGAKMDGRSTVAMAYFGDGATSEGDVHEACNFAAVFHAPVIFLCQNNQWAISVPLSAQTAAPIWRKATAYGFPGIQVDGNDVLAVYQATAQAAVRAREEGVPTLIEAVTYRMGPHSTADDVTKYRPKEEVEAWRARDPLERYQRWLVSSGTVDDAFLTKVDDEADAFAVRLRAGVTSAAPRPVAEIFQWVFADLPPHLARQRADALRLAGEDPASTTANGNGGEDADAATSAPAPPPGLVPTEKARRE